MWCGRWGNCRVRLRTVSDRPCGDPRLPSFRRKPESRFYMESPATMQTALMPLAARRRVTFLSRQESNQRNAHPVARRLFEPVPCAPPLKPGAAQLARIKKPIRAQTVLAHCSGLSGGARRAPTGERQQQRQHTAQFALLIAPYAGATRVTSCTLPCCETGWSRRVSDGSPPAPHTLRKSRCEN
jgi:hypothetical protein